LKEDDGHGWTEVVSSRTARGRVPRPLQDELDAAKIHVQMLQDEVLAQELQDAEDREMAERWPDLPPKAKEPQKTVVVERRYGFTATFSTAGTLGPGVSQRGECFLPALLPF
jgi:hypothetical protein